MVDVGGSVVELLVVDSGLVVVVLLGVGSVVILVVGSEVVVVMLFVDVVLVIGSVVILVGGSVVVVGSSVVVVVVVDCAIGATGLFEDTVTTGSDFDFIILKNSDLFNPFGLAGLSVVVRCFLSPFLTSTQSP